nr:hypothetical protein [Tanacetum cinerariifolium]
MVPFALSWGGSISLDSFLPFILPVVVIIVTVFIVAVILIFDVVAIIGVVIVVAIIGVVIVVMIIGLVVVVIVGGIPSIIKLSFMIIGSFSCYQSFTWLGVPIVDLTGDEDPIDKDGDTRVGDSEVPVSLGEKTSVAKRYLVKSSEELGELFLDVAGKYHENLRKKHPRYR